MLAAAGPALLSRPALGALGDRRGRPRTSWAGATEAGDWPSSAPRRSRCSTAGTRGSSAITAETYSYTVRDREVTGENYRRSLSQQPIPKIAPPRFDGWGDRLRFLMKENLPGSYPYTGGVFPYRREGEDPTRMFAGEGTPERTNRRFHYLSRGPAGGAPLDRVRLGDAVRRGPARAPGHLRQGRQLRRVDRDARRREEALLGL